MLRYHGQADTLIMTNANTAQSLKAQAASDAWFAREVVRRARLLGHNVRVEGPTFEVEISCERLGRDGWTVEQVQEAAS